MFFYDMWEVTDLASCSDVGDIIILQVGAEVWGSISKAGQGKVLEQKTKKVILYSKMSCTGLSWGMVSPVNCVGKLSTSLVNFTLVHAKNFFKWPILLLFQKRKSFNEIQSKNLKDTAQ